MGLKRKKSLKKRKIHKTSPHNKDPKTSKNNLTFKERLFSNNGEGISRLAAWFPLFVGSWLKSGLFISNLGILSLVIAPLIGLSIIQKTKETNTIPFINEFKMLVYVGFLFCSFSIFYLTNDIILTVFSVAAFLILLFDVKLNIRNINLVFVSALLKTLFPTVLGQLGILTQSAEPSSFYLGYCILGFVPGTILGSRELIVNYDFFKNAGWKRTSLRTTKKGKEIVRPGLFNQIVILYMISGASIPALLTPFGYFPTPFLLISLSFLAVPKIGEKLQKDDAKDLPLVALHLGNFSFLMGIAMLIAGLAS